MTARKTVLDNGMTIITEKMNSVRSVALGIWFRVGSRDEAPAEAGMSHFMEHMMFKGTPTRDARQLSEAFDRLGAQQNAFTSREYTCYFANFLDESLEGAFELLGDMVCHAELAQDQCELERQVIIEEIARGEDDPDDVASELFTLTLWPDHPLGLPIAGTREIVGGFGHEAAVDFRSRHYGTANCIVAAAGNLEHERLIDLAQRYLADLPQADTVPLRSSPAPSAAARAFKQKDTEQAQIYLGTTAMAGADERRFALALGNNILGGTMSSRLFQEIREKEGLVYATYSMPQLYQDSGLFALYSGTRPENAGHVAELMEREFDKIAAEPVSAGELEMARQSAKGALALSLESTSKRMIALAQNELFGSPQLDFDELLARYDAVTIDDIATVMAELGAQARTLAVVGPFTQQNFETR
ncbi:MAG: insulinase family protein [Coriobacteriia bacterium]|nr:insulinase family protein [Coriobacteriia bacterium]